MANGHLDCRLTLPRGELQCDKEISTVRTDDMFALALDVYLNILAQSSLEYADPSMLG